MRPLCLILLAAFALPGCAYLPQQASYQWQAAEPEVIAGASYHWPRPLVEKAVLRAVGSEGATLVGTDSQLTRTRITFAAPATGRLYADVVQVEEGVSTVTLLNPPGTAVLVDTPDWFFGAVERALGLN